MCPCVSVISLCLHRGKSIVRLSLERLADVIVPTQNMQIQEVWRGGPHVGDTVGQFPALPLSVECLIPGIDRLCMRRNTPPDLTFTDCAELNHLPLSLMLSAICPSKQRAAPGGHFKACALLLHPPGTHGILAAKHRWR